jgi:hypothetical protein
MHVKERGMRESRLSSRITRNPKPILLADLSELIRVSLVTVVLEIVLEYTYTNSRNNDLRLLTRANGDRCLDLHLPAYLTTIGRLCVFRCSINSV